MTTQQYTFDDNTVSDLHKDAYGFRPSQAFYQAWSRMSDDEKQAEWDSLIDALEASIIEEKVMQEQNVRVMNERLDAIVAAGAKTRADAMRWLLSASNWTEQDPEYFDYSNGLPYGFAAKTLTEVSQ